MPINSPQAFPMHFTLPEETTNLNLVFLILLLLKEHTLAFKKISLIYLDLFVFELYKNVTL